MIQNETSSKERIMVQPDTSSERRHARRLADLDARTVRLIRAFINPADEHGCEIWTGGFMTGGLPMISVGNTQVLVRPVIAELAGVDLASMPIRGWAIRNECGTPACVRFDPEHNALLQYGPKITEAQKEDARQRWLAAGMPLDRDCPVHKVQMKLVYRRPSATGRVYVSHRCNVCTNLGIKKRATAALEKRDEVLGAEAVMPSGE